MVDSREGVAQELWGMTYADNSSAVCVVGRKPLGNLNGGRDGVCGVWADSPGGVPRGGAVRCHGRVPGLYKPTGKYMYLRGEARVGVVAVEVVVEKIGTLIV